VAGGFKKALKNHSDSGHGSEFGNMSFSSSASAQNVHRKPGTSGTRTAFDYNLTSQARVSYDSCRNLLKSNDVLLTNPTSDWLKVASDLESWITKVDSQLATGSLSSETKSAINMSVAFIKENPPPECPIKTVNIPRIVPYEDSFEEYNAKTTTAMYNKYRNEAALGTMKIFPRAYENYVSRFHHPYAMAPRPQPVAGHGSCNYSWHTPPTQSSQYPYFDPVADVIFQTPQAFTAQPTALKTVGIVNGGMTGSTSGGGTPATEQLLPTSSDLGANSKTSD
jgi:hypothetical protein